jgi:hypothetical protein
MQAQHTQPNQQQSLRMQSTEHDNKDYCFAQSVCMLGGTMQPVLLCS